MSLLLGYAGTLLARGILDEYHVWNYARNPDDEKWIHSLEALPGVRIISPEGHPYDSYYDHYCPNAYRDAVFIKADDDIVYMDLARIQDFIAYRRSHPDVFLLSANIINNGVCAYFMQQHGAIPADLMELPYPENGFCGKLWESAQLADTLHRYFLDNRKRFVYEGSSVAPDRLSINFVSYLGKDLEHINGLRGNDEHALSVEIPRRLKRRNLIYHPCTVAHLSFYSQEGDLDTASLLSLYQAAFAAQTQKGRLAGKAVPEWLRKMIRSRSLRSKPA